MCPCLISFIIISCNSLLYFISFNTKFNYIFLRETNSVNASGGNDEQSEDPRFNPDKPMGTVYSAVSIIQHELLNTVLKMQMP